MNIKLLIHGIITLIPGMSEFRLHRTGGTDSARYCYSVWLRHLAMAKKNGLNQYPKVVAELGPGDSLGIGIAALISGSEKYYAFDVVEYANIEQNLKIFDELVKLFQNKTPIPGEDEFPKVKPYLEEYNFPEDIFDEDILSKTLDNSRLKKIRESIADPLSEDSIIKYKAPWYDSDIVEKNSVDMIYSQAVLEHVDKLQDAYKSMFEWLKPTGFISHEIDFKCHGTSEQWNGHLGYSDFMWKLIRGGKPYLVNRLQFSTHIDYLKRENFELVYSNRGTLKSDLTKKDLAKRYQKISDEDLITSDAFLQAVKKVT